MKSLVWIGLVVAASTAWGATYHVSPKGSDRAGNGSAARPWKTIGWAALMVNAGDVVRVAAGTYNEQVVVRRSGTPSAHIVFTCDTSRACKVIGQNYDSGFGNAAFLLVGNYIDVEKFDITTGSSGTHGVLGYGSQAGYRIIGNYVHDIPAPGCTPSGGAGIDPEGSSAPGAGNAYIAGNFVVNIGPPGCQRTHGIYTSGDGDHIVNNIVHNAQGQCISAYHVPRNQFIAFNTLDGCQNGGISYGSDGTNGVRASGTSIIYNIISNSRSFGIQECCKAAFIGSNTYDNNLIFNSGTACVMLKGTCTNVITSNPRFVNAPYDYHLQPGSPAIGAASSHAAPLADHDGHQRVRPYDIGALAALSHAARR